VCRPAHEHVSAQSSAVVLSGLATSSCTSTRVPAQRCSGAAAARPVGVPALTALDTRTYWMQV
jgi:hypothetical protein